MLYVIFSAENDIVRIVTAFLSGLVFGVGLLLSGMINPSKVLGFLDVTGRWDPSMIFVMGGAILVSSAAFYIARKRKKSWLGDNVHLPSSTRIDHRLIAGGLIFGTGWGLAGICPGPAVVSLVRGDGKSFLFITAMLVGMVLYALYDNGLFPRLRIQGDARTGGTDTR